MPWTNVLRAHLFPNLPSNISTLDLAVCFAAIIRLSRSTQKKFRRKGEFKWYLIGQKKSPTLIFFENFYPSTFCPLPFPSAPKIKAEIWSRIFYIITSWENCRGIYVHCVCMRFWFFDIFDFEIVRERIFFQFLFFCIWFSAWEIKVTNRSRTHFSL